MNKIIKRSILIILIIAIIISVFNISYAVFGNNDSNEKINKMFSSFKSFDKKDEDNVWNIGCFIFKNFDVNVNQKQYKYQMSNNDISQVYDCMSRFKNTCENFSENKIKISYNIIEIDNPINKISYDDKNGYYIDCNDVSPELDKYLNDNEFDHIFVCTRLSDDNSKELSPKWIGLGNMEYKGIGFSDVRMPNSSKSIALKYDENYNKFPEEVFVHEFLHSLEHNSKKYGFECPKLHDYEKYGYKKSEIVGLYDWYKDYMNCNINGEKIGLNSDIYTFKPVYEKDVM